MIYLFLEFLKGGCVHGDSEILLANYTTQAIKYLSKGDMILDGKLQPVKVLAIGFVYLRANDLYKFEPSGPIFTRDHQFFVSLNKKMMGVVSLSALVEGNPQLLFSNSHVELDKVEQIEQFSASNQQVFPAPFDLRKYSHSLPPTTKLYYLWTSSNDESYIVNGFISKDEVPNFEKWSMTYQLLGLMIQISNLDSYQRETMEDYARLERKTSGLARELDRLIENGQWKRPVNFDRDDLLNVSFDLKKEAVFEKILDTNLKAKFGMLLNKHVASIVHKLLESDDYFLDEKMSLMHRTINITQDMFPSK